jgi:UPF0755 protein
LHRKNDLPLRRRRSGCLNFTLILILTLACLGVVIIGVAIYYIPRETQAAFGPPADNLNLQQRLRYSFDLFSHAQELNQPADPSGSQQLFEVRMGESVDSIATRLAQAGIIRDSELFRIYLVYSGKDTTLQAGKYNLSPSLSAVEIAKAMQDATPEEVQFGILEGWRIEEIAAALPTSGLSISPEEFLQATRNLELVPALKGQIPQQGSLEGFLYPDMYTFRRDISPGEMLLAMTDRFTGMLTPEMLAGYQQHGLNLYQAVTLASVVQREAILPEEQPFIASVFYNRLASGMKLDSDPTVQYALGYQSTEKTWWANPLSVADLQVSSLYNTYQNPGLPPGPISNPGINALKAVAFPEQTPYYYFRAKCDGSKQHVFSETYDQHVKNACPE